MLTLVLYAHISGQYEGHLRLVDDSGSTGRSFGRLEVFLNGQWGTVCYDGFGSEEATVACGQLGYSSNSRVSIYAAAPLG